MKNKEIRKIAKEKMKGKMGKAIVSMLVYGAIIFGINLILECIPFLGTLLSAVIATPLAFGLMKQIICLENGEQIGLVDFFKHGIDNFVKVWGTSLWVALKLLIPIILFAVSVVMMSVGLVSSSGDIISMCSVVIMIASIVWLVVLSYKYCMVNYTLAYDNSNLKSKEIVNKSANEAKGHIWRFICMGMYYGASIFVVYFLGAVLMGVATAIMQDLAIIFMIIYYVAVICAAVYYGIMNMAACNEFYKINILGSSDANVNDFNSNVQDMEYAPDNAINYGYTPDNNGQSDDYFSNN